MSAVLRLPTYRRLLVAYTLNELAWSIGSLALAVLVYRRTGSAVGAMAFFLCSQFVPAVVSPVLVARLGKGAVRTELAVLYGCETLAFGALAWIASHFALASALTLVVVDGLLAVTARAISRAATVEVTRSAGVLREGNALLNGCFSVAFMVGPAIGATIVSLGGTSVALLVNSGLFAVISLVVATAHGLSGHRAEAVSSSQRLRDAFRYVRSQRAVRALFLFQAAALVFFTISIPVEIVFVQRSLHAGAKGYGVLLSAWGAGTVAGSIVFARWRSVSAAALIAGGSAALGIGFSVMAAAPSLGVAVAGAAVAGLGNGVEAVASRTALQEPVEDRWMSLVMSFNESMWQVVPGVGIALGGAITTLAGPRPALAAGGAGALIVALVAWVTLGPRQHATPTADPAVVSPSRAVMGQPAHQPSADAESAQSK
jgi:MFS family permease